MTKTLGTVNYIIYLLSIIN